MIRTLIFAVLIAATGPAFSQGLPKHYPAEGFSRSGLVDAIYVDERRIVINDIPYIYSESVVVHSMTSNRASLNRVRSGVRVAYKMGSGRVIVEIWLLPPNYKDSRRR